MKWRLILAFSFFLSCNSQPPIPDDIMGKEKMSDVLYDAIRADELTDVLSIQDSVYRPFAKRTAFYDSIFRFHGIDKSLFKKSLAFYQQRPDILKTILEQLQKKADTTSSKKAQINKSR